MADYDPTAPLDYDASETQDEGDEVRSDQPDSEGEDDDYDPSSFNFPTGDSDAQTAPPSRPKTVGGFVVDSDEEEEHGSPSGPLHVNGGENAQSGVGVTAMAEAGEFGNPDLNSEPQEDTAAISSAIQTVQTAQLSGVTPDPSAVSKSSTPLPFPNNVDTSQAPATREQSKAATDVTSILSNPQPTEQASSIPPVIANNLLTLPSTAQRLPHDKVGQLEDRIKEDPKADTQAWKALIAHYRDKDQLDNARKVYWRFFEVFPSASRVWYEFAKMELDHDEMSRVEEIFTACLAQYPDVDMWNLYLDYLRRVHPLISDTDGQKRRIIDQAFGVVLDSVGIDPDAGKLWREYIDFVKSGPGILGGSGWQDQQKMDLVRKAYQRAVRLPHSEHAKLWKEYDNFEHSMNRATARQNLMSQSPHYMTARGAKAQLEQKIEGLDRSSLPVLPPLQGCLGYNQFQDQVQKYSAWIAWEKEDPLVLKDDDIAEFRKRILYVYKQATMHLWFYPEVWFEAAMWCFEQGPDAMTQEGEDFLDKGIQACPESVLLALTKADRIENGLDPGSNDEIAIRNGEKLEIPFENVHVALYTLIKKLQERLKMAVDEIKEHFASLPPEDEEEPRDADDDDEKDDSDDEKPKSRAEQEQSRLESVRSVHGDCIETTKRTISYVWVAKMRAFRRVQGQGLPGKPRKGFRGVFWESRPRGQLSSDVYIASALMEWHCYKDPSAVKIFERGLKLFPMDEGFALEYIKFLISRNDDVNARAVFETTITKITQAPALNDKKKRAKCAGLLDYMHQYESSYGDLAHIQRLEKRMRELFPEHTDLSRFARRYKLPTFDAIHAQLVISPTQAISKPQVQLQPSHQILPTIEQHRAVSPSGSIHIRLGPNGPYVASPKRPLEDSDNDSPQRSKFLRGDSPLKGAAGRRLQNLSNASNSSALGAAAGGGYMIKNFVPGAGPPGGAAAPSLPDKVFWLLGVMPRAEQYQSVAFDPARMVDLIRSIDVDAVRARVGY